MSTVPMPRKFGGWLMLLVALLVVAALAMATRIPTYFGALPTMEGYYGERWPWLQAIFTTSALIMVLGNLYLCFRLTGCFEWRTVRIVIAGLWIIFCGRVIFSSVATALVGGIDVLTMIRSSATGWAVNIAFAVIWTAYLLRSKRVAGTYPKAQ